MKQLKLSLGILTILISLGVTHTAFARDGWHCREAAHRLNEARDYFNRMQQMVYSNSIYCPGGWDTNAACMMAIANGYNESVRNLRRAEHEYRRACRGRW